MSSRPPKSVPHPAVVNGALRLFRVCGIDVYVHWSWVLAAFFLIGDRPVQYSSRGWDIAEYLAGFGIVLLHEFGHAFACRSVGGVANRILLWPLGGLAFTAPPPRPGAYLWTVVAGPLVNVVLGPVLFGAVYVANIAAPDTIAPDLRMWCWALAWFNVVILVFNLLPLFPLDGGRILHGLLWFLFGPGLALLVASVLGIIAATGLAGVAVVYRQWWLGLMAAFMIFGCVAGIKQAKTAMKMTRAKRRKSRRCPNCNARPPKGPFWVCLNCKSPIDIFEPTGTCSSCGAFFIACLCQDCGKTAPTAEWVVERHEDRACPYCDRTPPAVTFWVCRNCKVRFDPFAESGPCPDCGDTCADVHCPHCEKVSALAKWRVE